MFHKVPHNIGSVTWDHCDSLTSKSLRFSHNTNIVSQCNITNARFYHNAGKCEQFIYGGCRGNENNFASLEACQVGDFWNVFLISFFSLFSAVLGKMHCRSTGGCRRTQVRTWRPELQQGGHRQVGQPRCVLDLCEFGYMLMMKT